MSSFDPLGLRPNDPLERWRDDAERRERDFVRARCEREREERRMTEASKSAQLRAEFEAWRTKHAERERIVLEIIGEEIAKSADEIIDRFEEHTKRMRSAMMDAIETRFIALEAQLKAVESRAKGRRRSSITELAFHGINTSRQRRKVLPMCPVRSVTYVSGRPPPKYRHFWSTPEGGPGLGGQLKGQIETRTRAGATSRRLFV